MYQTINNFDFHDAFKQADRADNFSYEGLNTLFDYFEELEEETREQIELDVIAICSGYTEYENFEALQADYDVESMEELEENTFIIRINDESFIIQDY